ncbi:hypothetical protein jhhlp_006527 [Lomentospora prolificans]|uniref:Uncharacterized protein n=1 Tax=Lomentospora prolificans TaxID=41688 RepID=A0A2N3N663_9PEZI|nr:hypothetical protein jhhlp_006527 [Lomentospora prolificans]
MVRMQIAAAAMLGQSAYSNAASLSPRDASSNLIPAEPQAPMIMAPLVIPRHGNTKRDRRAALEPQAQESLYWASQDGTVAELTISMPGSGESIVNLEHIDDMVTGVECLRNGTGQMRIHFAEAADLDDAEDVWQWVNQEPGNHFMLVVGAGACGWNEDRRVVYDVSGLVYNDESETVVLDVAETTWKEIAHTFSLNLGKLGGDVQRRAMGRRRGFFDKVGDAIKGATDKVVHGAKNAVDKVADTASDIVDKVGDVAGNVVDKATDAAEEAVDTVEDVAGDVVDTVTDAADKAVDTVSDVVDKVGDATDEAIDTVVDVSKGAAEVVAGATDEALEAVKGVINPDATADFSIPFNSDFKSKALTFSLNGVDVSATCKECFTKGSFDIRGSFQVNQFKTEEAWIEISTKGITAKAALGLTLKGEITGKLVEQSVPIFQASLAGISIPGVLTIGPTIGVELGAQVSEVKGSVGVTLGGTASIPSSVTRLDFLSEDKTTGTGWEPEFDAEPIEVDASVEAKATAFLRASVNLEISAVETGFSAELSANVPALTASLKAISASTCTVCGDHQAGIQAGLTLGTSLGISLKKKFLGDSQALWTLPLIDAKLPELAGACLGIGPSGEQCLAKRFADELVY